MDNIAKDYKFKFSIVMAVYNVEQFLEEAIDSIVNQNIGFEKYVQLILVDDGSKDSSPAICDKYKQQYPNNIVVIHKENGGVSTARNEGLQYVEGKYVNFLDSDDKLYGNTLQEVGDFFDEHYEEIDLVAIPIVFFDGQNGNHILNYKFNRGARVIDLTEEYQCSQLSIASAFIKLEEAQKLRFDTRLKYGEDAKECLRILMDKQKLGVISRAKYLYRKRTVGQQSALQQSTAKEAWYLPSLHYFLEQTVKTAKEKLNEVPMFIQYALMYDIQWRIKMSEEVIDKVLSPEAKKEYIDGLFGLLKEFDDKAILTQKHIYIEHKCFALHKKYDTKPRFVQTEDKEVEVFFGENGVYKLSRCNTKLDFMRIKEGSLIIEGFNVFIQLSPENKVENYVELNNGKRIACEPIEGRFIDSDILGDKIVQKYAFRCVVPNISQYEHLELTFISVLDGCVFERKNIITGKYFPLTTQFNNAYAIMDNFMLEFNEHRLILKQKGFWGHFVKELKLLNEYRKIKHVAARKAIVVRTAYHLLKAFYPKELWLLSDRPNKADDNGEAFFIFLNKEAKNIASYFVIDKNCEDQAVVATIGNTIDFNSAKHKFYHILAKRIVSSGADEFMLNPFGVFEAYYRDLVYNQQHIFLQHGITKDDISGWLNRYNKNLSMFVACAIPEYESLLTPKYFYDESVVKLTGFPRYDRLYENKQKIVTIMPTWRNELSKADSFATNGVDNYGEEFLNSDYYKFYNSLISNERLNRVSKELGYKIRFMPHPRVITFIDNFAKGDNVEFCHLDTKYRDIFAESSLVVTDYSSVAFDFAYLRKPVVYCQFDKENFFKEAVYDQGYFDYERDGFGEVEYDLEATVDRIIEYMREDCKLKHKYQERIEKFYAFNDKNNCKRVYEAIMALEK